MYQTLAVSSAWCRTAVDRRGSCSQVGLSRAPSPDRFTATPPSPARAFPTYPFGQLQSAARGFFQRSPSPQHRARASPCLPARAPGAGPEVEPCRNREPGAALSLPTRAAWDVGAAIDRPPTASNAPCRDNAMLLMTNSTGIPLINLLPSPLIEAVLQYQTSPGEHMQRGSPLATGLHWWALPPPGSFPGCCMPVLGQTGGCRGMRVPGGWTLALGHTWVWPEPLPDGRVHATARGRTRARPRDPCRGPVPDARAADVYMPNGSCTLVPIPSLYTVAGLIYPLFVQCNEGDGRANAVSAGAWWAGMGDGGVFRHVLVGQRLLAGRNRAGACLPSMLPPLHRPGTPPASNAQVPELFVLHASFVQEVQLVGPTYAFNSSENGTSGSVISMKSYTTGEGLGLPLLASSSGMAGLASALDACPDGRHSHATALCTLHTLPPHAGNGMLYVMDGILIPPV